MVVLAQLPASEHHMVSSAELIVFSLLSVESGACEQGDVHLQDMSSASHKGRVVLEPDKEHNNAASQPLANCCTCTA